MKKWMLIPAAFLWAACNNTDVQSDAGKDSVTTEEEVVVVEEDKTPAFRDAFPQLQRFLEQQDTSFDESQFVQSGETKIEHAPPAAADDAALKPFAKYFVYNSDSSLAADIYSYNYIITKRKGKEVMEEAGPDAEAGVIDRKTGQRRRVFFGGPSYVLLDAKWIDKDVLLLTGSETLDGVVKPMMWEVPLRDSIIKVYEYSGELDADVQQYRKSKTAGN